MKVIKEFIDFLKEYKVIGLAIGIIMGTAITALVNSLVNDLVMPTITPFIPGGAWREANATIGPVVLKIGSFGGQALNFVIIAFVIFMMAKLFFKEDKVSKK